MAKKSIKEIRALAKKKVEGNSNNQSSYNKDIYPFWKMKEGEVAKVRFLPDKNEDNDFPFVERLDHWLSIDGKNQRITSPKTFDPQAKCPIAELSAEYYDAGDEENGKYYYRSAVHLSKALVLSDPLPPDPDTGETYEGKVVTLQLGYQLYTKFMEDLGNVFDDDDPLPWDMEEGFNFNIKKLMNGTRAKWDTGSFFDRKPSAIPDEYLENIKLIDLRDLLGDPVSYDEANEFLAKHLSGGTINDDDDLSKKRKTSTKSSSQKKMLEDLGSTDEDEDEDESQDENPNEQFDDVPDFDEDDNQDQTTSDNDDDDDDDLSDLKSILKRQKKS